MHVDEHDVGHPLEDRHHGIEIGVADRTVGAQPDDDLAPEPPLGLDALQDGFTLADWRPTAPSTLTPGMSALRGS